MSPQGLCDLASVFGAFALIRVEFRDDYPTPPEVLMVFDVQE